MLVWRLGQGLEGCDGVRSMCVVSLDLCVDGRSMFLDSV